MSEDAEVTDDEIKLIATAREWRAGVWSLTNTFEHDGQCMAYQVDGKWKLTPSGAWAVLTSNGFVLEQSDENSDEWYCAKPVRYGSRYHSYGPDPIRVIELAELARLTKG